MSYGKTYPDQPFKWIQMLEERLKLLVLQEFVQDWLYHRIKRTGSMTKCYDEIEIPMYISPPTIGKWFTIGDKLPDPAPSKPYMGRETNRYLVVPSGSDMLENMIYEHAPNKIFDKADLSTKEVAWGLRRAINSGLWNGSSGRQPNGIAFAIEKAAPAAQTATVTGIAKATNHWFRNQYVQLNSNFGFIAPGSSIPAGFLALSQLLRQCTIGTNTPSDLITNQDEFEMIRRAYKETSTPFHMIQDAGEAKYDFDSFSFQKSKVGWEGSCPADSIYALKFEQKFGDKERLLGDAKNPTKMDLDFEEAAGKSLFDTNGSIGLIGHPNIQNRSIAPRTSRRGLDETSWTITSVNLVYKRLNDQGVAGSDNGSRWSTW